MSSMGPLSGMPLSSLPRWRRTRTVIVPCKPVARLQPGRLHARLEPTYVDVVCSRVGTPTALLVSTHWVNGCRVDMDKRPTAAAIQTLKRWEGVRVVCSQSNPFGGVMVVETTPQIVPQVVQFGATPIDTTELVQPTTAKGEIRVKPHEC